MMPVKVGNSRKKSKTAQSETLLALLSAAEVLAATCAE